MVLNDIILNFINSKSTDAFSDPYYIYDSSVIRKHCRVFQNIFYENKSIHFASMANINPYFLKLVKNENINIFVNSVLHLKVAQKVGFKRDEIIFTSSALTEKKMQLAYNNGVQVNLDSQNQLDLWMKLFPDKPVGIRCNIGKQVKPHTAHAGYYLGEKSRLGFTSEEISRIKNKSVIKGLHLYVGTDIFSIDYFIKCYKALILLAVDFPNLEYLNFGGGFGVSENGDKSFDFARYNKKVTQLMNSFSKKQGKSIKMILEPGRIIGSEAGYFVCTVADVKIRADKRLVGVNASTVQFPRPLMYPDVAKHPVKIIREGVQLQSDVTFQTTIYGCSTYSRDLFIQNVALPELKTGDTVVFGNAGSYSASSFSNFLGFEKPEEYFIKE